MHPQRSRHTISGMTLADIDDLDRYRTRFWSKVAKSTVSADCWLWTAAVNKTTGYGAYRIKVHGRHRSIDSHRFAYLLTHGAIAAGLCICHSCDSTCPIGDMAYRRCVRPDHLWAGTQGDNVRDARRKGRMPQADLWRLHPEVLATFKRTPAKGEMSKQAKLTAAEVAEIRTRYAQGGITQVELAVAYGVNQPHISRILRQTVWGHLEGLPERPHPYAGNSRLSPQQVRTIRVEHRDLGLSLAELARRYAVSHGTIWFIVTRQTWKDI